MKQFLIVVDMQRDFVDGALGSENAQKIVPAVVKKINSFTGDIFVTMDTHFEDYLETSEGRHLPVKHCIKGTEGWRLNGEIEKALSGRKYCTVEKYTFGSDRLPQMIKESAGDDNFSIELAGLCTDICVVSNALVLKANFPENTISVDASCCAGVTPETHAAALTTMKMCQIEII